MEYFKQNKTIIVRSSPENSYYKQLKSTLDSNKSVVDGLKDRKLEIVQDTTAEAGEFNLYLYGQDGSLLHSQNEYSEGSLNKVFDLVDSMKPKSSQTGGGDVDYRYKYQKYKAKCNELEDVITNFKSLSRKN
jgi:hypothetical protein